MSLWKWILDNKQWLFDGFAGALIVGAIGWMIAAFSSKPGAHIKQKQRGGRNSTNVQIGHINKKTDE